MMNRDIRTELTTEFDASAFRDKVIWLPDLMRAALRAGQSVIKGRTFDNCALLGPAVFLAIGGVDMDACNLGYNAGDIRNMVLRPVSPTNVIGTLPFQECRFFECEFDAVGFTGSETFIQSILQVPQGEVS